MRALLAAARPHRDVHVSRGPLVDPWLTRLAIAGVFVTLMATIVGQGIALTTARHEARQKRQAACDAEARALIARKPILANTLELADRCAYLRRLQGRDS